MTAGSEPFDPQGASAFQAYAQERSSQPLSKDAPDHDAPASPAFTLSVTSAKIFMRQSLHTRRRNGRIFRLHPGYLDRADPNAFASCRDGVHLCGLHSGLVAQLLDLVFFALAQKTTFLDVGDPAGEKAPASLSASSIARWMGATSDMTQSDGPIPQDPARFALAEDLAQLMLRFVWFHELYHCVNGHVGYLQQFDRSASLHEMPDIDAGLVRRAGRVIAHPSADELRLLEMDADRSAIWACFMVQAHGLEHIPTIAARPLEQRQKLALFAACLMTVLFERAGMDAVGQGQATHPLPYLRLQNVMRTIASNVTDGLENMRPLFLAVAAEIQALQPLLPGLPDIEVLYDDLMSPAFQRPLDDIEDGLDALREKLAPFAYFNPG